MIKHQKEKSVIKAKKNVLHLENIANSFIM